MNATLRAVLLAVGAAFGFTVETLIVKAVTDVPLTTIILARALGQMLWITPALVRDPMGVMRTRVLPLQLLRGGLSTLTWYLYFYAFAGLPLATGTVLSFTALLFVTALAGPVLGEKVGLRRWSATLIGFAGVVVILRPGGLPLDWAVASSLAAALFGAAILLMTKMLSRIERTETIMFYIGVVSVGVSLPLALPWLAWPGWTNFGLLLLAAFCGPLAMQMWITSLRLADASFLAPIGYVRLVFATAFGVLLFDEVPDWGLGVGGALIIGSAIYITRREAQLARQQAADAKPEAAP